MVNDGKLLCFWVSDSSPNLCNAKKSIAFRAQAAIFNVQFAQEAHSSGKALASLRAEIIAPRQSRNFRFLSSTTS